jgi:hypothetical protein
MRKDIYLIRGLKTESYKDFKKRIFDELNSISGNSSAIKLTITEEPSPSISVIPFYKSKIAAISIYNQQDNDPDYTLLKQKGFTGIYSVTEALPVAYDKTWNDGEITPGVCLLTLFRKRINIDYDTFINRWHNGHTPLSLKIHPLWHYNRNVVMDQPPENGEKFDGIVEEHCRSRSELFNPFKFFGNPLVIVPRMLQVYFDVKSFLDYSSIESYLVSEYYIKS